MPSLGAYIALVACLLTTITANHKDSVHVLKGIREQKFVEHSKTDLRTKITDLLTEPKLSLIYSSENYNHVVARAVFSRIDGKIDQHLKTAGEALKHPSEETCNDVEFRRDMYQLYQRLFMFLQKMEDSKGISCVFNPINKTLTPPPKVTTEPPEVTTQQVTTAPPKVTTEPPEVTTQQVTTAPPIVTTQAVTTPKVTTPTVTTPEVTTPKATSPKVTTPNVTTPKVTIPKATTAPPIVTTPEVTTPKATTPKVTIPMATTPEATTSKVTMLITARPRVVGLEDVLFSITYQPTEEVCIIDPFSIEATLTDAENNLISILELKGSVTATINMPGGNGDSSNDIFGATTRLLGASAINSLESGVVTFEGLKLSRPGIYQLELTLTMDSTDESISLRTEDITVTSCGARDRTRFSFALPLSTPTKGSDKGLPEVSVLQGLTSEGKLDIQKTRAEIESFVKDENLATDDLDVWQANDCLIIVEYYTEIPIQRKLKRKVARKLSVEGVKKCPPAPTLFNQIKSRNIKVCGTGTYAGRSFALRCDEGLVVNIERANYGIEESDLNGLEMCDSAYSKRELTHAHDPTPCKSVNSLAIVRQLCNGRSECLLQANDKVYGDECKNTARYLTVDYSCDFSTYSDYAEPTASTLQQFTTRQPTSQQPSTAARGRTSTLEPPTTDHPACTCKVIKRTCLNRRRKYVKSCTGGCTGRTWFRACTPYYVPKLKAEGETEKTSPPAFTPTQGDYYTETYKRFQRVGYGFWG